MRIIPANEAPWEDLRAIFGVSDYPGKCYCQRYKAAGPPDWSSVPRAQRPDLLREQASRGSPGLVGYLDEEPAGWVAVEPRTAYPRLTQTAWRGRDEDRDDDGVWSVTCFVVRKGYRKRGLTYPLAAATVPYARSRGARTLEAYAMITEAGKDITWGELHVGARQVFEEAGFTEVHRVSKRRVIMRISFS
jgi:GNAT superfamily N-acetyltransferase